MTVFLLFLLGAFSNGVIRGGLIEVWLGREIPGLRIINALIFGAVSWWLSSTLTVGVLLSLGMFVGSTLPLGRYIKAILGEDPDHDQAWGYLRLTIRGTLWASCIALGATIASFWHPIPQLGVFCLSVALAGAFQGILHLIFADLKPHLPETTSFNAWTMPEFINGGLIFSTLIALKAAAVVVLKVAALG